MLKLLILMIVLEQNCTPFQTSILQQNRFSQDQSQGQGQDHNPNPNHKSENLCIKARNYVLSFFSLLDTQYRLHNSTNYILPLSTISNTFKYSRIFESGQTLEGNNKYILLLFFIAENIILHNLEDQLILMQLLNLRNIILLLAKISTKQIIIIFLSGSLRDQITQ